MDIQTYIHDTKKVVSSSLTDFLKNDQIQKYSVINRWGNDAVNRILSYTLNGKFLRSAFLFLSAESFSENNNQDQIIKTASALELFQTGLLIHDDIMDQDESRRGLDSMHIQYNKILSQGKAIHSEKLAESFALSVGDMSFSLAFQMLSTMQPSHLSQKLTALLGAEFGAVCIAQMQDVYGPQSQSQWSKDEILSVYTYKTGRYSVGLPLASGGMIAGADEQTLKKLWKLGTSLGILFQIRDDWLNLFGDPQKTGKPVGSDIREGKQTLYRLFLLEKCDAQSRPKLRSLYGRQKITKEDVAMIQLEINKLHVDKDINEIVEKQIKIVTEILSHLPIPPEKRILFDELIRYINEREK